jgi:hypothetical protein
MTKVIIGKGLASRISGIRRDTPTQNKTKKYDRFKHL